jgi:hypothetical protein
MITVLVKEITPRIEYTMNLVFNEVMGVLYSIITDPDEFQNSKGQKINYSKNEIQGCLRILPSDLLYESELVNREIEAGEWKKFPTIFANDQEIIPFDLFAAIFYLVSRYEEYLPYTPDEHRRFEANQSISFKNNFLHIPIVDIWCQQLAKELNIYKYCKFLKSSNYTFTLTIDIDHAWMFKHTGIIRNLAKLARELIMLRFKEFNYKIKVLRNKTNDPGDSYAFLEKIQKKLAQQIKYFILSGGNHKFDTNISIDNKNILNLIQSLDKNESVGLHPSFSSNRSFDKLSQEYEDLTAIVGRPIETSRQHYLMLTLPETYRSLIRLGIKEDHTMGYGTRPGFRAGIARPFYFYDLYEEKQTLLRIFPFQVMDRTLISSMNHLPDDAIKEFKYYTEIIKSVGGHFIALWHNTSLNDTYEWKGWKRVFKELIAMNEKK